MRQDSSAMLAGLGSVTSTRVGFMVGELLLVGPRAGALMRLPYSANSLTRVAPVATSVSMRLPFSRIR